MKVGKKEILRRKKERNETKRTKTYRMDTDIKTA